MNTEHHTVVYQCIRNANADRRCNDLCVIDRPTAYMVKEYVTFSLARLYCKMQINACGVQ